MLFIFSIGKICQADTTEVKQQIETIIAEDPEVIVLFDYEGGPDMDEMIQSLYDNAALQDISAIKNKKVISLDYKIPLPECVQQAITEYRSQRKYSISW